MSERSEFLRRHIRECAAERAALHAAGARQPDAPPELVARYAATRAFLEKLTAPDALARLSAGDPDAVEYALCFLEVYPLCPDSGFAVRDLVRALRDTSVPDKNAPRLRAAMLTILNRPPRDEFKHLRRLALRVADTAFIEALDRMSESAEIVPAENARVLAAYITNRWRD